MLQNVKNILMDLDSNYPEWEQNLQENSDFSAYEDAELGHRMLDLVFSFKDLCKKRESCSLDIFTELVRERKTAEILQGKVERVLIYYKAFRPIREMFSKDPEAVMELFKDIFLYINDISTDILTLADECAHQWLFVLRRVCASDYKKKCKCWIVPIVLPGNS